MGHCATRLDEELGRLGRAVLSKPGPPTKPQADNYALAEYEKFDATRKLAKQAEAKRELAELKATAKTLPSGARKREDAESEDHIKEARKRIKAEAPKKLEKKG